MAQENRRFFIQQLLQYDFEEEDDEDDDDDADGTGKSNHRGDCRDDKSKGQLARRELLTATHKGGPKQGIQDHIRGTEEVPSGINLDVVCRQHLLLSEPLREDEVELQLSVGGRPQSLGDASSDETDLNHNEFRVQFAPEQEVEGPAQHTGIGLIENSVSSSKHEWTRRQQLHTEPVREGSFSLDSASESVSGDDIDLRVAVAKDLQIHGKAISTGNTANQPAVTDEVSSQSFTEKDKEGHYRTVPKSAKPSARESSLTIQTILTDFEKYSSDSRALTEPLATAKGSSTDFVNGVNEFIQEATSADATVRDRREGLSLRRAIQRQGSFENSSQSQSSEDDTFVNSSVVMTEVEEVVSVTQDVEITKMGTAQCTKGWKSESEIVELDLNVKNDDSRLEGSEVWEEKEDEGLQTQSSGGYHIQCSGGSDDTVPENGTFESFAVKGSTGNGADKETTKLESLSTGVEADLNVGVYDESAFHLAEFPKLSSCNGDKHTEVSAEPEPLNSETNSAGGHLSSLPESMELDVETHIGVDPHLETSREELELGLAPSKEVVNPDTLELQDCSDTQKDLRTADPVPEIRPKQAGETNGGEVPEETMVAEGGMMYGNTAGLTERLQEHPLKVDYVCNDMEIKLHTTDGDDEVIPLSATINVEGDQVSLISKQGDAQITSNMSTVEVEFQHPKVVPSSDGFNSTFDTTEQAELRSQVPDQGALLKETDAEDNLLTTGSCRSTEDEVATVVQLEIVIPASASAGILHSESETIKRNPSQDMRDVNDAPSGRVTRSKKLLEKVLATTENQVDSDNNGRQTTRSTSAKRNIKVPRVKATEATPDPADVSKSPSMGEGSAQQGSLSAPEAAQNMQVDLGGPTWGPYGGTFSDLFQSVAASESTLPQEDEGGFPGLSPGFLLSQVMEIARQPNALIGTPPNVMPPSSDAPPGKADTLEPKSRKKKKPDMHNVARTMVVLPTDAQQAFGSPSGNPVLPLTSQPPEMSQHNAMGNIFNPSLYGFASTSQSAHTLMRMETDKQLIQAQTSAQDAMVAATSALAQSHCVWARIQSQVTESPSHLSAMREAQIASVAATVAAAASVAKAAVEAAKAIQEASNEALTQLSMLQGNACHTPFAGRARRSDAGFVSCQGGRGTANPQPLQVASGSRTMTAGGKGKNKQKAASASRDAMGRAGGNRATGQEGRTRMKGQEVAISNFQIQDSENGIFHRECEMFGTMVGVTKNQNKPKEPQTQDSEITAALVNEEAAREGKEVDSRNAIEGDQDLRDQEERDHEEPMHTRKTMLNNPIKIGDSKLMSLNLPSPADQKLQIVEHGGGKNVKETADLIEEGSIVEVMSEEEGLRGGWFSAKVLMMTDKEALVVYDELLTDDGRSQLKEWFPLSCLREEDTFGITQPGVRRWMRPVHPFSNTRKRRRITMVSQSWAVGDHVDAFIQDGWWEGVVSAINEDDETRITVYFPGEEDTAVVKTWNVRPSLIWADGEWMPWKGSSLEEDGPPSKRQKVGNVTGKTKREETKTKREETKSKREETKTRRAESKMKEKSSKKLVHEHKKKTPELLPPRKTRQSLEAPKSDNRGIMVIFTGKVGPVQPAVAPPVRELRSGIRSLKTPAPAKSRSNRESLPVPKKPAVSTPSTTPIDMLKGRTPSTRSRQKPEAEKRTSLRMLAASKAIQKRVKRLSTRSDKRNLRSKTIQARILQALKKSCPSKRRTSHS